MGCSWGWRDELCLLRGISSSSVMFWDSWWNDFQILFVFSDFSSLTWIAGWPNVGRWIWDQQFGGHFEWPEWDFCSIGLIRLLSCFGIILGIPGWFWRLIGEYSEVCHSRKASYNCTFEHLLLVALACFKLLIWSSWFESHINRAVLDPYL